MLFADVRGFTAYSEKSSSADAAAGLSKFYKAANQVLTSDNALVEFIGDQVMALYIQDFPGLGDDTPRVMVGAAERLIAELDRAAAAGGFRVGVGIHLGTASVGNFEKGGGKDFTAVGDVVNTAARLQSQAQAGEIVVSDEIFRALGDAYPQARREAFDVKGKEQPVHAFVIGA